MQGYPPSISSGFPENSPIPIYTPGVLLLDGPSQGYPSSISSSVPENSPVPIYTPRVLLLDGTLVHCKVTCPAFHQDSLTIHQYLSTLLGDTVRVKCSSQERNIMSQPDLKPRPLNPESSALTIRNKGRYLAE